MAPTALKDYLRESRLFQNRVIFATVVVVLLFSALVIRLIILQVINHQYFITLSQDNRVKVLPLPRHAA